MSKQVLMGLVTVLLISGGNAATTYSVTSNITGVQWWLADYELLTGAPGGYFSDVRFSGTATDVDEDGVIDSSQLSMSGELGFVANDYIVKETFTLADGHYVAGVGTTFESGSIINETFQDGEWYAYGSYVADWDHLEMVAGEPGHNVGNSGAGSQITAGLQLAPGTTALPGLWNGIVGGSGYNNAVTTFTFLGNNIGMYLQGTVTLTPVPLPAGIWLFGAGLVGLAGIKRKRRAGG